MKKFIDLSKVRSKDNMKEEFLKEKLISQYGEELCEKIFDGFKVKRYTTFRVNTLKGDVESVVSHLQELGFELKSVPWYPVAFISLNKSEEDFYELEEYKEGKIYLQSLSSMLPVLVLGVNPEETVLDMTAAPGSKTTQMAMEGKNLCRITACEKNAARFERLKYNTQKQGVKCCTVLKEDARNLDSFFRFDKILLDAPCSGTGTIVYENIEKNSMLTHDSMARISETQKKLLCKALSLLNPNETMVYSTCSILEEENEGVILYALNHCNCEVVPITLDGVPLLPTKINGTLCVLPNEFYEGFFVAKLKKKSSV